MKMRHKLISYFPLETKEKEIAMKFCLCCIHQYNPKILLYLYLGETSSLIHQSFKTKRKNTQVESSKESDGSIYLNTKTLSPPRVL